MGADKPTDRSLGMMCLLAKCVVGHAWALRRCGRGGSYVRSSVGIDEHGVSEIDSWNRWVIGLRIDRGRVFREAVGASVVHLVVGRCRCWGGG